MARIRRVSTCAPHRLRRVARCGRLRRLGRTGDRGRCVDVQPALRHRVTAAWLHPHRGSGVLRRHPRLRTPHLHGGRSRAAESAATGGSVVTGLGYTLPAVLAVVFIVAWEVWVLRTGLFRRPAYWISMVIVFGFQ